MRKSIAIAALSLALVLSWLNFSVTRPVADDALGIRVTPTTKWEYYTMGMNTEAIDAGQLTKLGAKGWELVCVQTHSKVTVFIMKRPLQ